MMTLAAASVGALGEAHALTIARRIGDDNGFATCLMGVNCEPNMGLLITMQNTRMKPCIVSVFVNLCTAPAFAFHGIISR